MFVFGFILDSLWQQDDNEMFPHTLQQRVRPMRINPASKRRRWVTWHVKTSQSTRSHVHLRERDDRKTMERGGALHSCGHLTEPVEEEEESSPG